MGLSRNESAELVETVLSQMSDALVRGETVKISSFGSFTVRAQGPARRPQSQDRRGSADQPRRVLVFRPSHVLKERVDSAGERKTRVSATAGAAGSPMGSKIGRSLPHHQRGGRGAGRAAARAALLGDRFTQVKPLKRGGGRRYYRPEDVDCCCAHPRAALRRRLHHQGRAEDPARAGRPPRDRPRHAGRRRGQAVPAPERAVPRAVPPVVPAAAKPAPSGPPPAKPQPGGPQPERPQADLFAGRGGRGADRAGRGGRGGASPPGATAASR